MSLNNA